MLKPKLNIEKDRKKFRRTLPELPNPKIGIIKHFDFSATRYDRSLQNKRNLSRQFASTTIYNQEQLSLPKLRELSSNKKRFRSIKNNANIELYPNKNATDSKKIIPNIFINSRLKKKLKHYIYSLDLINLRQKIQYKALQPRTYNVYIGKGNNSKIIKKMFQNRFWWNIVTQSNANNINLHWTQWSKQAIFKMIPPITHSRSADKIQVRKPSEKKRLSVKKKDIKKIFEQVRPQDDMLLNVNKKLVRSSIFASKKIQKSKKIIKPETDNLFKIDVHTTHNHVQGHEQLTDKKNLFYNLKEFCDGHPTYPNCFEIVPLTYHISQVEELESINAQQKQKKEKHLWIVKPGQNSNRGSGIHVFKKVQQIKQWIQKQRSKHAQRTFIVQSYIFPFLFHRRKFDIRCFVLITANPKICAYFYQDGYLRTSCRQFTHKNCSDKFIHLTNDAIQKKSTNYSKFEIGNKVSFGDFEKYLEMFESQKKNSFKQQILPELKKLVKISIMSAVHKLNVSNKHHTFQIFGYDFMIDSNFKPWLIQINTNPSLQICCPLLNEIIPSMVENVAKIAIDPIFKPPRLQSWPHQALFGCPDKLFESNKFELIFEEDERK